ncbi:hypothetical protein, partial [Streptomyces sp. URMC 123]|uniref:hypothetical protein n=1 Tax=Streptomyces sp. URMC 123 TaxID=3423403 RepID=UPI003F1A82EC
MRSVRSAVLSAAVALAGATAALGGALILIHGPAAEGEGGGRGGSVPTATGSLEQLAAKTRCTPVMQTDAAELRQGVCRTDDGQYVLATFATVRGRHEWLSEARDYGGTYLVGRNWVAVGEPAVLGKVRGRLGGERGPQRRRQ